MVFKRKVEEDIRRAEKGKKERYEKRVEGIGDGGEKQDVNKDGDQEEGMMERMKEILLPANRSDPPRGRRTYLYEISIPWKPTHRSSAIIIVTPIYSAIVLIYISVMMQKITIF